MCKTDKNARNDIISSVSFNTTRQIVQRKLRNWIYINELTDFGGQNETKYNSNFLFLYYYGWHLRKQQKIKAKNSYVKIKLKARNKFISSPREEILLRPKRGESGKSNLFRDQSYFNCVISVHLFLFSFVL